MPELAAFCLDEDAWDALDEIEGQVGKPIQPKGDTPFWVPPGMDPVLEEHPKWTLLAEILKEIEEEIIRQQAMSSTLGK